MSKREEAEALFLDGANCAQAVLCAFCDETGLDRKTAMRIASSFGGGMGRMREVCGAVSGMCMVAGMLYGYDDLKNDKIKGEHYRLVQELCDAFRKQYGTIICRELLQTKAASTAPVPTPRTEEYYRTRPCARQVGTAAEIIERYIQEHPIT